MLPAFEKLHAIPGVLGAFTASAGELRASSLPAFFTPDGLDSAGEPMLRALEKARNLSVDVTGVLLSFGDTRVVLSPLTSDCLIVVVCQETTDIQSVLEQLENLEPEYTAIADYRQALTLVEESPDGDDRTSRGESSGSASEADTAQNDGGASKGREPQLDHAGTEAQCDESPSTPATQAARQSVPDSSGSGEAADQPRHPEVPPHMNAEQKERIQLELACYVGPVASLLVASAMKSDMTASEIIKHLGQEIESEQEREAFLEAVSSLAN